MEWQKYGTNPRLDKLVDNDDWNIRREATRQGYGLDVLINDEDWGVRLEIAKQGYGLDVLVNDEHWRVREEVAKQGYGLDVLINDDTWYVREAVARQGYGLNILINDENYTVRASVASQGYGFDILVNDEDVDVRGAVKRYLKEHNKSLVDWMRQNPDKIHGDIDTQLTNDLKDFIYKIDESSKLDIQSDCDNIDDFFIEVAQDILVICTVDTKEPIIKIEKSISDQKINFKFIIDITNEDGESFSIKTFIKLKEQLNQNIEKTIEYLNQYPKFNKYVEDLERCLL